MCQLEYSVMRLLCFALLCAAHETMLEVQDSVELENWLGVGRGMSGAIYRRDISHMTRSRRTAGRNESDVIIRPGKPLCAMRPPMAPPGALPASLAKCRSGRTKCVMSETGTIVLTASSVGATIRTFYPVYQTGVILRGVRVRSLVLSGDA